MQICASKAISGYAHLDFGCICLWLSQDEHCNVVEVRIWIVERMNNGLQMVSIEASHQHRHQQFIMSSLYEPRGGTMEGARNRKQSMAELKLRRLQELVARLREDLDRRRIPVSEAATEYVLFLRRIEQI